jgi:hypothetical protein
MYVNFSPHLLPADKKFIRRRGVRAMAAFTFELIRRGEAPMFVETVDIGDEARIWCHVEVFALRMTKSHGAFIRVLDDKGQAVVRAGVATALASISKCACIGCPLKSAAIRTDIRRINAAELSPCHKRGSCSCGNWEPKELAESHSSARIRSS